MSDRHDRLERWVGGALAAASFAALVQLSTLPAPPSGRALLWAARCFAGALPLALLVITLSLFQTGGRLQQMHPRWRKALEALAGYGVVVTGLTAAAGAAFLACHVVTPGSDPWGWPTWLFIGFFVAVMALGIFLDGADWIDRRLQRRRLQARSKG